MTLGVIGTAGARSKDKYGTRGCMDFRPDQLEVRARAREITVDAPSDEDLPLERAANRLRKAPGLFFLSTISLRSGVGK